jgi:hypothetical protein
MTTSEAGILLQRGTATGAMPCMQLYRRADGTIITDDCPVGLRRVRDQWRRMRATAAAALALLVSTWLPARADEKQDPDCKVKVNSTGTRGRPSINVLRGEPQPLGGKPAMPVLGGMVAPTDWQAVALKNPSVKKMFDELLALEGKGDLKDADVAKAARLRLKMADEAEKNKVLWFASSQLQIAEGQARKINGESALLKSILQARLRNAKALGQTDTKAIEAELNNLK